jgi:AsmA family protein
MDRHNRSLPLNSPYATDRHIRGAGSQGNQHMKKPGMKVLVIIAIVLTGLVLAIAAGLGVLAAMDTINWIKPMVVGRISDSLGRRVAIAGDLEIIWSLPPAFGADNVRLANVDGAEPANMITAERVAVIPDWAALLDGRVAVDRISMQAARIILSRNDRGRWNLPQTNRSETSRAEAPGPLPTIQLTDSLVKLPLQGKMQAVAVDTLTVGAVDDTMHASGRLRYREVVLSVEISAALLERREGYRLDAVVEAGRNRLTVKGDLTTLQTFPEGDLRFTLKASDPGLFFPAENLPRGLAKGTSIAGRVSSSGEKGRYRISDLEVQAGSDAISGWIEMALQAEPIELSAGLTSRHLDLRAYLPSTPAEAEKAARTEKKAPERILASEPIEITLPGRLVAEADVNIQTLLLPFLRVDELAVRLTLRDGRLDLEPMTASVGGGSFDGQFHLVAGRRPAFRTQGTARRLDLAEMLAGLAQPPALRGEVGFQFNIDGRGRSPAEMAASLNGRFSLAMQGGRIARRWVKKAEAYSFEMTDAFFKLLRPETKPKDDYARIECAVCRFDLDGGIAESNVLVFDTARAGVVGDGSIDLGEERFDLALKPITDGGVGIPGVFKLKVGTTVADAFKLSGTFKAPVIGPDKSESALSLGKAIGGMLLFGPAGLTAGLLEAEFGAGNPCVDALQKVEMIEKPQGP